MFALYLFSVRLGTVIILLELKAFDVLNKAVCMPLYGNK